MKIFLKLFLPATLVAVLVAQQTPSPAHDASSFLLPTITLTLPSTTITLVPTTTTGGGGGTTTTSGGGTTTSALITLPGSSTTTAGGSTTSALITLPGSSTTTAGGSTTTGLITLPTTTLPGGSTVPTTLPGVTTTLPGVTTTMVLPTVCPFADLIPGNIPRPFVGPRLSIEASDLGITVIPPTLCDLRDVIITDNGIGALVPDVSDGSSRGIYTEGHKSNGAGEEFQMNVASDGTVTLLRVGNEALNLLAAANARSSSSNRTASASADPCCPAPCSDESKNLAGFKEKDEYRWRFNKRTVPGSLNKDGTAAALKSGAKNIREVANSCGIAAADLVLRLTYLGQTSGRANLDSYGNCLNPNGKNVVDFGPLPVAGRTCSWYYVKDGRDSLAEADIRLDSGQGWTLAPGSGSCSGKLDVEGVATHEVGHAFGLAHVSTAHKNLTMTERLPLCSTAPRSLGRGDVNGLRALY